MLSLIRGVSLALCALTAILCFDALARPHYDLDPTSVLASVLDLPIETLGIGAGILSTFCLLVFLATIQDVSDR